MNIKPSFLLLPSLLIILSCTKEGFPLENSHPPQNTVPDTMTVFPSDTIGILMGDSNYVFGTIGDAVTFENGNIAILDEIACCAKVYDSNCSFLNQISRSGSGPGEVLIPGGMALLSDSSLVILDAATGGAHRFEQDGSFIELLIDFQGQAVPQWTWGVDDMAFVGATTETVMEDEILTVNFTVGRWERETEPVTTYFRNSFPFDPGRMDEFLKNTFFSCTFAAGRDGIVAVAPISSSDYLINLYYPDGSLKSTIQRDLPRVEKNQIELDDETAMVSAILRERGVPPEMINYQPDSYRSFIAPQGLGIDGEGRIWATNGTSDSTIMDVYSPEGDHLAVVQFNGVKNPQSLDFLNIKIQSNKILVYSLQDSEYPRLYVIPMPELE